MELIFKNRNSKVSDRQRTHIEEKLNKLGRYLDQISQTRTVANLKRRLERLGFQVTLQSKAQSAA